MVDRPIKVDHAGPVFHYQFVSVLQPFTGHIVVVVHISRQAASVKSNGRILHIGGKLHASVEEPGILGAMGGDAEHQALLLDGSLQQTDDVLVGSHVYGVPRVQVAVVHGESIVMLGHGDDILRSCLAEKLRPLVGIELLGLEHRDEVFVTELGVRAVSLDVMLILARVLDVHVARIPFAAESRDRINTPVDEDAELAVAEPFGKVVMGRDAVPVGLEDLRTLLRGHRVDVVMRFLGSRSAGRQRESRTSESHTSEDGKADDFLRTQNG